MTKIEHSLKFVTEFDESHPVSQRFLSIPKNDQILMLENMLKDLLANAIQPELDRINENGTYAILKIAE